MAVGCAGSTGYYRKRSQYGGDFTGIAQVDQSAQPNKLDVSIDYGQSFDSSVLKC